MAPTAWPIRVVGHAPLCSRYPPASCIVASAPHKLSAMHDQITILSHNTYWMQGVPFQGKEPVGVTPGVFEVLVELYIGALHQSKDIVEGAALPMEQVKKLENGRYQYEGQMLCLKSGQFGFTVRVIPYDKNSSRKFDPDFKITWA